jgi:ABC-type uncharacterized transport system permease subunit
MWELVSAVAVSIIYILVAGSQLRILNGKSGLPLDKQNLLLGFGIFVHFILCSSSIRTDHGPDISIDNISSLVAALIALMVFLNSFKKPVLSLFIGISPIAAAVVMWSVLSTHSDQQTLNHLSPGLAGHIILSITSYAFFSIAALQAILLLVLNKKLKQRHNSWNIIKTLPPLQTMEHLLFNMLWTGFILLTGAMVAGVLFVEDLFEQHLVHKTTLSIAAWVVFGTLLLGHQLYGWRGKKAIRWTLGGWALLLFGYFGSRVVLEFILQIPASS